VLLSRIPQPEGPEGKKIVAALDQIFEELHSAFQIPVKLDDAASAIESASKMLAAASKESASAAISISRAVSDLVSASNEVAETLKSTKPEAVAREGAPQITAADDLARAIRDLQKAVSAPIHITLSRD
jgi:hypothetical protein